MAARTEGFHRIGPEIEEISPQDCQYSKAHNLTRVHHSALEDRMSRFSMLAKLWVLKQLGFSSMHACMLAFEEPNEEEPYLIARTVSQDWSKIQDHSRMPFLQCLVEVKPLGGGYDMHLPFQVGLPAQIKTNGKAKPATAPKGTHLSPSMSKNRKHKASRILDGIQWIFAVISRW